jgi:hypothetical protein
MPLKEEFLAHLEQFHTAPFLFVGSGLSRRYLGLEDWEGLLRRFAALTDRPYEYFRSSANGLSPAIAAEIARELHGIWWQSPTFEDSRLKYSSDAKNRESALKIEISRYLESVSIARTINAELTSELELLATATIDGIITTNWDLLLEDIFPEFEVYIGQDELLFSPSYGVGEVYKIHGCCSKPNTLVATDSDYERFDTRNPYLAAKLLTVFAEHPVIFLGYSLNDENVSGILQSIALCLTSENINQLRNRLILVRWDPTEESHRWEDSTIVTHGFSIPVKTIVTNSFIPIFASLSNLERKFPARILRRLKEHVYELVLDNDPADRLHVMDIDDDSDISKIKVVYGVGLKINAENKQVSLSSEPEALQVRLTENPNAPELSFSLPSVEVKYPTLQAELVALVRTWRPDNFAYIPHSRLRVFYSSRNQLELTPELLKGLLVSAMHHQAPVHFWALRLGRDALIPLLWEEVSSDLSHRIRYAARLAYAVGMSDGEQLLGEIAKRSQHKGVKKLAKRLQNQLKESSTIHAEYRSPIRTTHLIDGRNITVDVTSIFENGDDVECVLSYLVMHSDLKSQTRAKQLDAYFYGTKLL